MSREDFAWMFVRAFGVYFLVQFFMQLSALAAYWLHLAKLYEITEMGGAHSERAEIQIIDAWFEACFVSAGALLLIALAYYCMRKGAFVHRLICYRPSDTAT